MDDLAIFSRTLTATEISNLYTGPICHPPSSIFATDTGAAGLLDTIISTPQLTTADQLTAAVTPTSSLRFWLGVKDTTINPPSAATFIPDLGAGAEGLAAGSGLITPCRTGFSTKPPFISCSNPGGGIWTASFCGRGTITLQFGITELSGAITLIDVLFPGRPVGTLTNLGTQLQAVPLFQQATHCLGTGAGGIGCVSRALLALAFNEDQLLQTLQILNGAGLNLTLNLLTQALLDGVSLSMIQTLGDLIVFDVQTRAAGHQGTLTVTVTGQ